MTESYHASPEYLPPAKEQLEHYRMLARIPELRTPLWTSYRISQELNTTALADAIKSVVGRHEGLRIGIREGPGGLPVQWIRELPPDRLLISRQEVRATSRRQFEQYVRHVMARNQEEYWSLSESYPFKFVLLKYSAELYALIVGLNHLAMDARARELVLRDLWHAYNAQGGSSALNDGRSGTKSYVDAIRRRKARDERSSNNRRRRPITRSTLPVPPITQFLTNRSAPASKLGFVLDFTLNDTLLVKLRSAIHESEFSEAQWILAALAHSVFGICPHDRIQFPISVDLRDADERDLVGMFVTSTSVILDRPGALTKTKDFLSHVRQQMIHAMMDCQRSDVDDPDLPDVDQRTRWGARPARSLWFNYRRIPSDQSGRLTEPADVERDAYSPNVLYSIRGISSEVISTTSGLRFRIAFNDSIFSMDAAEEFATELRNTLSSLARHGTDDNCALAVRVRSAPQHIVALTDGTGNVVAWADLARIAKHIGKYLGVMSTTLHSVSGSAGETLLEAVVAVSEAFQFTDTEFRDQLLNSAEPQRLILAPHKISLSRDTGSA